MNANLKYEIQANAFRRLTNEMAPGKDDPERSHLQLSIAKSLWAQWQHDHGDTIQAMLEAMDDVLDLARDEETAGHERM